MNEETRDTQMSEIAEPDENGVIILTENRKKRKYRKKMRTCAARKCIKEEWKEEK